MLARRVAPAFGLVLLIAAVLPFRIWRASLETSLWIDETASLVLAQQPAGMILDTSAIDTNPPGYYLLLKAWLKAGRALGLEPGILWARLLGVLAWVALAAIAWSAGQRLFGSLYGTVLAVAVAGSSYSAVLANDARGYSIASVALFSCFLILLRSYQKEVLEGGGPAPWRPAAARWLLYTAGATAALWTHLLSLLVLGCLALLWLVLLVRSRAWASGFARFGAVAQAAALLLFLPWLAHLQREVAGLRASAPTWMTPPTGLNLSSVFWWWYPFGRVGDPNHFPTLLLPVLGALSVLLPLAAAAGAGSRRAEERQARLLGALAYGGLGISFAFVLLLWELQRLGAAPVFYAPRYPALSAALWAGGLVGLAGAHSRRPGIKLWGFLLPWIACSVIGQWWGLSGEAHGGLDAALAREALPEEQRYTDGWSYPEVSAERRLYRWASRASVAVRFDRPLPAGDYVVHYQGYRSALPRDPAAMAFRFGDASQTAMQPQGEVLLQLRAHLSGSVRHPVLVVEHPLWSPAASGSSDSRRLASAFFLAWVEPATP